MMNRFPLIYLTHGMPRFFMIAGALAGAVAVGLGAFGAHYIKDLLSPSRFDVYLTGARYLMIHAVILFVAARMNQDGPSRILSGACIAFFTGMIAFSGSLILLGLTGARFLGAVAPVGGTAFITGWVLLAIAAWKNDLVAERHL